MNSSTPIPQILQKLNISQIEFLGDRKLQEDFSTYVLLDDGKGILTVLADGMGGHAAGEVASRLVVETFIEIFRNYPSNNVSSRLTAALQQANASISTEILRDNKLDGMGSTIVAAHISDIGLQWISVGDSLLYLIRHGKVKRLNADHSMQPMIDEALKLGKITQSEADQHPHKHSLRSAVIGHELPLIDVSEFPVQLKKGDVIIVASDGILTLDESALLAISNESKSKSKVIVSQAINLIKSKKRPKQDNTTIQAICIGHESSEKSLKIPLIIFLCAILVSLFFFLFSNLFSQRSPEVIQIPQITNPEPQQGDALINSQKMKVTPQIPEASSLPGKTDLNTNGSGLGDGPKKQDIDKENNRKKNENHKQQNKIKKSPEPLNQEPQATASPENLSNKKDITPSVDRSGLKNEGEK